MKNYVFAILFLSLMSVACGLIVEDDVEVLRGDTTQLVIPFESPLHPCRFEFLEFTEANWLSSMEYFDEDPSLGPKVVVRSTVPSFDPEPISPTSIQTTYIYYNNAIMVITNGSSPCDAFSPFLVVVGGSPLIDPTGPAIQDSLRRSLWRAAFHQFVGHSGYIGTAQVHQNGILNVLNNDVTSADTQGLPSPELCDLDPIWARPSPGEQESFEQLSRHWGLFWEMIQREYGDEVFRALTLELTLGTALQEAWTEVNPDVSWNFVESLWACGEYWR